MNILVDRHHAGLYHSLQLLFEDRLGHMLYTPVGHDWWDEGYWNFGRTYWGDDRLARQFLTMDGLVTSDPEFPGRDIYGVTLGLARAMPWGAVIATVPDNQAGFHRFAQEHGAKFVVQVGNTNQEIDWSLDPLVINSSEMPLLGRGVRVGQEFDSDGLFAFRPPDHRYRIASFVNCMPQIQCYPLLRAAEELLPDFYFAVHGIDGPNGNIKPIAETARIMRHSGWGWHDKAHGDGFGHVLHYWAAIGRPLVGHASHYAGKIGEKFWRDGETCIDLDRHSLGEAAGLIREISADAPRHEAMCHAIRAVFDATVDWARDAELVRGLLA